MERNGIFTVQDVIKLYNEFQSYESMWNDALDNHIHHDTTEPAQLIGYITWFHLNQQGWSNDEIIAGVQAHSIEE